MQIITGWPVSGVNGCDVMFAGNVVDTFDVEWTIPDDDLTSSLMLLDTRIKDVQSEHDQALAAAKWADLRTDASNCVRAHFLQINRDDYAPGDLPRMLAYNHYLFALVNSLRGVKAVVTAKNVKPLGMSGQPDDYLAADQERHG